MSKILYYFIFVFAIFSSSLSRAGIFEGPASVALGGAGAAAISTTDGSHMNPATLTQMKGYHIGLVGISDQHAPTDTRGGMVSTGFGLALTDASEEVSFPGTFGYSKGTLLQESNNYDVSELHFAMGYRIIKRMSVGLAFERVATTLVGGPETVDYNSTLGFLVTPRRDLGVAVVLHDMLNSNNPALNPTTTLGAHWSVRNVVRFRSDWSVPQKDNPSRRDILGVGIESLLVPEFALRVGGKWNRFEEYRTVALGLGWKGPRLSIDYAYEKDMDREDFRHLIDLRVQL